MGILWGKDLVDGSVSKEKLDFDISSLFITRVTGSITLSGNPILLPIEDIGLILHLEYRDATVANLYAISASGTVIADIKRSSIYGGASLGSTFDNVSFGTTVLSSLLIDDILMDSSDYVTILIRVNNKLYNAFVWISGSGTRADMWYYKI